MPEQLRIMPGQCEHSDFEDGPYSEIPVGEPRSHQ